MPITPIQTYDSYAQGRQNRLQSDFQRTRNQLATMETENAPQQMAQQNQLADMKLQGAQQELNAEQAKMAHTTLLQALDSGNPRQFILQNVPQLAGKLQEQGLDLNSMDDQSAASLVQNLARKYGGEAGIAPVQPKTPEAFTLSEGQTRFGPDGRPIASTPKPNAMSPYESARLDIERKKLDSKPADTGPLVQVAGPDGNPQYATREQAVGKPAYVARDKPAAADVKWQREIKSKQPRLQAAVRRVERLAEAAKGIAQIPGFDGGPVDQYFIGWTKAAQELKQASAALTPELTALTRVPGIGSQSDLETRLAGLQFPSTEFDPEVNAKAVAELQAFMKDLQDVYGSAAAEIQSSEVSSLLDKYAPQK